MKITKELCKEFLCALPNEATTDTLKNSIELIRKMFKEIESNAELEDEEAILLETKEQGEYFMEFAEFKKLVYDNTQFYMFDFLENLILLLPKFLETANKLDFNFQLESDLKHLEKINKEIEKNIKRHKKKELSDE